MYYKKIDDKIYIDISISIIVIDMQGSTHFAKYVSPCITRNKQLLLNINT